MDDKFINEPPSLAAALAGWRPIETAPKDGTSILAYARGHLGGFCAVAQWADADPDFPRSVAGWFWPFAIRPTHWQELPEPPQ